MYSFAVRQRQARVDARAPAPTSTPRPPWRRCRAAKPTVYFGSYDGKFYAFDARSGKRALDATATAARSPAAPTVVGDIVYFSNCGKKDTTGLGARTGHKVFHMGRGAFNPVISDGRTIFLTGYSSPVRAQARDE